MRLITLPYEAERVHSSSTNHSYDDRHTIFSSYGKEFEIATFGDSFTNGGGIGASWRDSYPHQLFLMLNEKYTVINKGACEDTTRQTYKRFKDYFDKKDSDTHSIVTVMVGAADVFFEEGTHMDFAHWDAFLETEVLVKIERPDTFWHSLRTPRMIRYVLNELSKRIEPEIAREEKPYYGYKTEKLKNSFILKDSKEKRRALSKALENFRPLIYYPNFEKNYGHFIYATTHIVLTIISENYKHSLLPEQEIVSDLLHLIEVLPRTLGLGEVAENLVKYTMLQSKYQIEDDIIPAVEKAFSKDKEFLNFAQEKFHLIIGPNLKTQLGNLNKRLDKVQIVREDYFNKMIDLSEKKQATIIFLTYPLEYRRINNLKRELASERDIHLIDIEKVFSREIKEENYTIHDLITDWQHCSPEGYQLIARELSKEIKKNIDK